MGNPLNLIKPVLVVGILAGLIAPLYYHFYGYSILVVVLWLFSSILIGFYFFTNNPRSNLLKNYDKTDIYIILILFCIFILLYSNNIFSVPYPISFDELLHITLERKFVHDMNFDFFRPSGFVYFPVMMFMLYGGLGKLIGGITLVNMRFISALFGVLTIPVSYLFFRLFSTKKIATCGSILIGFHHAFFILNRMAWFNNSVVFFELAALGLFYIGFIEKNKFFVYLSGIVAGISFYGHFIGRIIILMVILNLILFKIFFKNAKFSFCLKTFLIFLLAFGIVTLPVITYSAAHSDYNLLGSSYVYEQSLLFEQGRNSQKDFFYAPTIFNGVLTNIINGILVFNRTQHDVSGFYFNPNHGFLDVLSGIFLWIGILLLMLKKHKREPEIFLLGNFFFIWILFIFIINKTPHYTRLLIILPFVSYLIVIAIEFTSNFIVTGKKTLSLCIFMALIASILIFNVKSYFDYVDNPNIKNEEIGVTARYIYERNNITDYNYILVTENNHPYARWGHNSDYGFMIGFFANDGQNELPIINTENIRIISPKNLTTINYVKPFTIFMRKKLWDELNGNVTKKYEDAEEHILTLDLPYERKIVAIESK